jgi:hypothetical protein
MATAVQLANLAAAQAAVTAAANTIASLNASLVTAKATHVQALATLQDAQLRASQPPSPAGAGNFNP